MDDLKNIKAELTAILSSGNIAPMVDGPARRMLLLINHLETCGVFQNIEQRFCNLEAKVNLLIKDLKTGESVANVPEDNFGRQETLAVSAVSGPQQANNG